MSGPGVLLRMEGLAMLAGAAALYANEQASWWMFAVGFFLPDLSMVGLMGAPRVGSAVYNAVHTTVVPLAMAVGGLVGGEEVLTAVGLIWLAHIGFDRLLGFGLRYPDDITATHLAQV